MLFWLQNNHFDDRYVVCIAKGMKPHLVLNDEEKQQRFEPDHSGVGDEVGDDGEVGVVDDVGDNDGEIGVQV